MPKQENTPMTRKMPPQMMGISKIVAASKMVDLVKQVATKKMAKKMC
jgi:hypothetical protein